MTDDPGSGPAAGNGLVRVRLDLAYDGTRFAGWARQPGLRTVQGCLEAALDTVLRREPLRLTCAGRTDAGVHARGQVAHFDVSTEALQAARLHLDGNWSGSLLSRLNGLLDDDVRVRGAVLAPAGFDARFSALWRRYAYRVCDDARELDPLRRSHVLWRLRPLDLAAMNEATTGLLGEHDFVAFCRQRSGATTVRALHTLEWVRDDRDGLAVLTVCADAFCHHMVRALTGALLLVGDGRRGPAWPAAVLAAGRRDPEVPVAPPRGLTLEEVSYPDEHLLLQRAERTRAKRVLADPADAGRP